MGPQSIVTLNTMEYNLLMLCKDNLYDKVEYEIAIPQNTIFQENPEFWYFYNEYYWTGEGPVPYKPKEVQLLFHNMMSNLLFKICSNTFKTCMLQSIGLGGSTCFEELDVLDKIFNNLKSSLKLQISTDDYEYNN
jgi:hypothetical protein